MSDATGEAQNEEKPIGGATRRGYLIGGGLLLAGIVVLAIVVWTSRGGSDLASPPPAPTASTTASPSSAAPTETSTPTPVSTPTAPAGGDAATPAAPVIDSFEVSPVEALCQDDRTATVELSFSWVSTGATQAWLGAGTTDASRQPIDEVETSETGYGGIAFECFQSEQTYTLTVRGEGGDTSASVTVTRLL